MPYATPGLATNANQIGRGRPEDPNTGRLGLHLGLGAQGREAFRGAANTGQLDTFLAGRGLDRRYEKALNQPGPAGTRAANFQAVNAAAAPPAPAAPVGVPAIPAPVSAAANGKAGGPGPAAPAVTTGTPKAPSFAERLAQTFGEGNPYGMQSWYGGNPLDTAKAAANQQLAENQAALRERYGASGLGNSDRMALAEGTALAQSNIGLGDVLAQRGQDARNADASRLMSGMLTGEQLAQSREQMPIAALAALNQSGAGLADLQTNELNSPLMQMLIPLLTGYSPTTTSGDAWTRSRTSG